MYFLYKLLCFQARTAVLTPDTGLGTAVVGIAEQKKPLKKFLVFTCICDVQGEAE